MLGFYEAEIWTFRKIDQKYLQGFEMWWWSIMEMIRWTDREKYETVPPKGQGGKKSILHTEKWRKAKCTDPILCRNCFLELVIEGKL